MAVTFGIKVACHLCDASATYWGTPQEMDTGQLGVPPLSILDEIGWKYSRYIYGGQQSFFHVVTCPDCTATVEKFKGALRQWNTDRSITTKPFFQEAHAQATAWERAHPSPQLPQRLP